jgi:hypothetical protein
MHHYREQAGKTGDLQTHQPEEIGVVLGSQIAHPVPGIGETGGGVLRDPLEDGNAPVDVERIAHGLEAR